MFLPIVQKVLPYINALVISLQRLFEWLSKLLGIDVKIQDITSSVGNKGDLSESLGIEDLSDDLDNATSSAKKLKNQLMGFDELNVINSKSDSGNTGNLGLNGIDSGILDSAFNEALENYQAVWDKAFSELENRANEIADKIVDAFKRGDYKGIGEYISTSIRDALNRIDWNSVYSVANKFGKGLAEFFNGLIRPDTFYAVGKTIVGALNTAINFAFSFGETFDFENLGLSIANAINGFFKNWDAKKLAQTLNIWVDGIKKAIIKAITNTDWGEILSKFKELFDTLEIDTLAIIIGALAVKKHGIKPIANILLEGLGLIFSKGFWTVSIPQLAIVFQANPLVMGELGIKIEQLLVGTIFDTNTWTGLPKKVDQAIENAFDTVAKMITDAFINFISTVFNWNETQQLFDDAKNNFKKGGLNIALGVIDGFAGAVAFIFEPITDFFKAFYNGFCTLFGIHSPAEEMKPIGKNIFLGIIEGFSSTFEEFNTKMQEFFENYVTPWLSLEKWLEIGQFIYDGLSIKFIEFTDWWGNTAIVTWWTEDVEPWFSLEKWLGISENIKNSISTKWTETTTKWKTDITNWWNTDVSPWFTLKKWGDMLSSIPKSFKEAFRNGANGAIEMMNKVISGVENMVNGAISALSSVASLVNKIPGVNISFDVSNISLPKIPQFEFGGFPQRASLFWAGENGIPELMGTVGGKTAVASGDEITGIKEAVYETSQTESILLQTAVSLLQIIANKEFGISSDELYNSIRKSDQEFFDRTGDSGFAY